MSSTYAALQFDPLQSEAVMSILLVQLTGPGILFGADRNVTEQQTVQHGHVIVTVSGQTQRPKVLKWPNHELIVGYVGQAELEGRDTDVWLYAFIGRNLTFPDLDTLAEALQAEVDALFQRGDFDQPMIIHLGGFELVGGEWTPRIYFIRNTVGLTPQGAYVVGTQFDCTEELSQPPYFVGQTGKQIQKHVYQHYFSFRQGYDLAAFGVIEHHIREAMMRLIFWSPRPAASRTSRPGRVVEARPILRPGLRHLLRRLLSAVRAVRWRRLGCRLGRVAPVSTTVSQTVSPNCEIQPYAIRCNPAELGRSGAT